MREILFRGKRIRYDEWVEGNGLVCQREVTGRDFIPVFDKDRNIIDMFEVDPSTVGQFTGLLDKNGKKIFEGDIIDASNEWWSAAGPAGHDSPIIAVEFSKYHCGFDPFADYDCDCDVYIKAKGCEIIGNIHDNPEILEGAE
jgi:uncharacterized phage protein (TIGR01671 family)